MKVKKNHKYYYGDKHIEIYTNRGKQKSLNKAAKEKHTLLENRSLFSKLEQRNTISTTLLEATVSSAWTVSVPKFLEPPGPFLLWRLRVKLRLCLVTICSGNDNKLEGETQFYQYKV